MGPLEFQIEYAVVSHRSFFQKICGGMGGVVCSDVLVYLEVFSQFLIGTFEKTK